MYIIDSIYNKEREKMSRFTFIAEQATDQSQARNNRELMQFHYFNKNGLVASKRENDERIAELVEAGVVPSGWHFAYGTFADYSTKIVIELAKKRRVRRIQASVAIDMLKADVERVSVKIQEVAG